jgi:TolB protein
MVYDFVTGTTAQAGPSGRTLTDPSWAPTGGLLASGVWLAGGQRFSQRQGVLITRAGVAGATYLVGSSHTYSDPSWNAHALAPATIDERIEPGRLLAPVAPATPPERAEGLVALQGVRSGGRQALAAGVYPSFAALRQAVIAVSGHDFLSHLSEATRPVDFNSSSASYTSWHKAGRAFDTLFSYSAGGRQVLYISPDPVGGRLLWRLYLYTARQDGSQGAPITAAVFNPSSRTLLPPPEGYFVDFTDLALQHGWRRIAAQERDNFNWQSDLLALEYWHFDRRDGLSWYAAMALIYDERTLERLFNVDAILAAGSRPSSNLGLPWAPPSLQAAGLLLNRAGPR